MSMFEPTPWETRNLGLPSYQLNTADVEQINSKSLGSCLAGLDQAHKQYFIFARLPKRHLRLAHLLENHGFYLIESTVAPYLKIDKSAVLDDFLNDNRRYLPKRYRLEDFKFETLQNNMLDYADELRGIARESFSNDRFHLDNHCAADLADARFSMWVGDLISDPEVCFDILHYQKEVIGFIARKGKRLVLGGFKQKYLLAGLGEFFILNTCVLLKQQDFKVIKTLVSVNNLMIINLYAGLGFKFKDTHYSFHYWQQ